MKFIIAMALVLITASAGFAGLARDPNNNLIQGFAPNGMASQVLTVNSTTFDMTNQFTGFSIFAPTGTTCFIRIMKTSSKTGTVSEPVLPVAQWSAPLFVNPLTPFVNVSGCTAGWIRRM